MFSALKLVAGHWRLLLLGGLLLAVWAAHARNETLSAQLETTATTNRGLTKTVAVQRVQLAAVKAIILAQARERLAVASRDATQAIREDLTGSYYDPATSGYGVVIDDTGELLLATLYVYDSQTGERDWYVSDSVHSDDPLRTTGALPGRIRRQ